MLNRLRRWDSLGLRLFLLMWAALVVSHFAAWSVLSSSLRSGLMTWQAEHGPRGAPPDGFDRPPRPQGLDSGPPPRPMPPGGMPDRPPQRVPTFPSLPPNLPWGASVVDYGVRLLFIALAAWWGSRWLAQPVRRLVSAAQQLTPALSQGRPAPVLDEADGTREVRDAAAVFNRMAAELSGQFEERGLMMAAISHDLRTPLTRMRLRLETGEVEAKVRERCIDDLREMNGLVESVIEVFRPAEAVRLQRVDLSALAQSAVDDLAETGAAVSFEGPPAVVHADPVALRRVLDNLVGNALRYAGNARVRVDLAAGVTRLIVDDDGPGIPDAELERVRQPFRRLESSRNRDTGGTGLGLYIAQQLVRRQGAVLVLGNRPEGGLRAEVVF
ncbi:ATP-binding protein [Roseateles puraquae]|uniref:histidine kinase n=1 Tax=Roseateles puraquae TaxID=431059 RepID=A0A254N082_9BURK|nr:ATP-binding protein [Roseateles puraquae]MDG0855266.1 HAMP domain-containing protein [Roseateles puraquae]MDG0855319.1 HAMP domain-containing protein [Roseateles puraquae]OWR01746.1 two-component sensor histidine kinase [Roseateles puraquae]